jgi:predicted nucleic acid-binding protein
VIVVDTKVIAYITFATERSSVVASLHERNPVWEAPILWKSEFLNVLSLYYRKKLIDPAEALDALDYAERLMSKRSHQVSPQVIVELIINSTCSSYDCEFVALAQELGTILITYDKKILHEFPTIAMKPEDYLAETK